MDPILLLVVVAASLCIGAAMTMPIRPVAPPTFEISDEHIARIAHEANRAYCITIGDLSKRAWQNTEPEVRASTIRGVRFLRANPSATPEQMHEHWCETKREQGYRYGPTICHKAKTHYCLVPYDELPEKQRFKDYLFMAIVRLATVRG